MKNTLNNLFLAIFLALISQGIQAQFDDIYYDPDRTESSKEIRKNHQKDTYSKEESSRISSNEEGYAYDDENGEWENQDYYYTSRIKRFHRPYLGFDYYHGGYVDNYYYDPYNYDPFYFNQDIYVSSYGYHDYYRWRRWQLNPWNSFSYWNQWDWIWGWSSYPITYRYNYWSNNCYNGYYNNYYSNNYYYGGGYNHWNNNNDNHPNGTHFGSRKFGLTNSSNRGPVRVVSPSPRVFTESHGDSYTPSPDRSNPKRVIRSADGDTYRPGPVTKPERSKRIQEFPGTKSNPSERENNQPRTSPQEYPGEKNTPTDRRPESKREFRPERTDRRERAKESKPEFKPERMHREEQPRIQPTPDPAPRIEIPKESYQPRRENSQEQRVERRQESNGNSRSESSGSRSNSNSDDHRKPPR